MEILNRSEVNEVAHLLIPERPPILRVTAILSFQLFFGLDCLYWLRSWSDILFIVVTKGRVDWSDELIWNFIHGLGYLPFLLWHTRGTTWKYVLVVDRIVTALVIKLLALLDQFHFGAAFIFNVLTLLV